MRKTKNVTIEKAYVVCDVCSGDKVQLNWSTRHHRCCQCHKDLCSSCVVYDDSEGGDYPPKYCQRCWDIGEPFRKQLVALEAEYDKQTEAVEQAWRDACTAETRN